MNDDLRKKVEEKQQYKKAFGVVTVVFVSISIVLYIISMNVGPEVAYWVRFPTLILGLILLIVYVSMFGFSMDSFRDAEWDEEEIQREMAKMRLEERAKKGLGLTENEELILKDLEHADNSRKEDSVD